MRKPESHPEWVDFGDVAHGRCGMQSQYCSRYVDGRHDSPCLGDGLRFRHRYPQPNGSREVDAKDYHCIEIHRDDVNEFARRVNEHRRQLGQA